ncbi:MAG: Holliday junction resolvase RuvX [Candidatus Saccharibacteria bacterium]
MPINHNNALALDVGSVRIGVAVASLGLRFARPLTTLGNDDQFFERLAHLVEAEAVSVLVVGLPRGLEGQETAQTQYVRSFVERLKAQTNLPVHFQDEALTSAKAKAELQARGKIYQKGDVDALAATYILEDYLTQLKEAN